MVIFVIPDWVFDHFPLYGDCKSRDSEECEALGYYVTNRFNRSIDAPRKMEVKCEPGMREDTLPDWVWRVNDLAGKEHIFSKFISRQV